ncbi:MAG TPA: ComEC/Rec2 family competence protein [Candidatus Paceibacterota bacterium]|nr:ComEC/Rec2 family competence protein [Candidatus Paceibacterota bacterium]
MAAAQVALLTIITFLVGVLAASAWPAFAVFCFGLIVSAATGGLLRHFRKASWFLPFLLAPSFALGFIYYRFNIELTAASYLVPFEKNISAFAVVTAEPKIPRDKYQELSVDLEAPYHGRLRVLASPQLDYRYGDRLLFVGRIEPATPPDEPITLFPKIKLVERDRGNALLSGLLHFKETCLAVLPRNLPKPEAAFLAGLTFGDTRNFGDELKEAFRRSGTTHLVALSGYNIAILIYAVGRTLGRYVHRRLNFLITLVFIGLFVVMVGAEASVVRAAIMGALTLFAVYSGRRTYFLNIIALAAFLMTLIDPTVMSRNVSFQLSFASVIGLAYLGPALKTIFRISDDQKDLLGWREQLVTTCAAQLAVLPIILNTFGNASATAVLANLLILPFVPLMMLLGFILIALGLVLPLLAPIFAWIVHVPLAYGLGVINAFALLQIPVSGVLTGWFAIIVYYLILIYLAIRYSPERIEPL